MKYCRYGNRGEERPGLIDPHGRVRDLSHLMPDITGEALAPVERAFLAEIDPEDLPLVQGSQRFGCPVAQIGKVVAIGLNYVDHALEAKLPIPTEPVVFFKPPSCIVGPADDIVRPKNATKLDWEVELGVIIGSEARCVSPEQALEFVAGYCAVNDVSERAFQWQSSQWDKGKSCDTFGPVGPWLVTADEIANPQDLDLWLDVNGCRMQTGNTRTMIFSVAKIVSYLSHYMTLQPGDLICTGTPPGVGMGHKPKPVYLNDGDVVTLGISGLGEQCQTIVGSESRDTLSQTRLTTSRTSEQFVCIVADRQLAAVGGRS
jgi:2,4-diketo-3-deoxy-L-fuconate hydrolase